MKTCKYCLEIKDEDQFPTAGVVKGKHYRRLKCYTCFYEMRSEYKKRQRQGLLEIKQSLKCNRCGFEDHRALQFHHTNNDKTFNVGGSWDRFSLKTILTEIDKCEVVCANCHQIEHYNQRETKRAT